MGMIPSAGWPFHRLVYTPTTALPLPPQAILRPLSALPSLLILGGDDEYVVDQPAYQELGRRMAAVLGANATVATVEGGNHGLEGKEGELVTLVLDFLAGLPQQP